MSSNPYIETIFEQQRVPPRLQDIEQPLMRTCSLPQKGSFGKEVMKVQIIEQNESTRQFIKTHIEKFSRGNISTTLPPYSCRADWEALLADPAQVCIVDIVTLENLYTCVLETWTTLEIHSRIILIRSPEYHECFQKLMESGISSVLLKPLDPARLQQAFTTAADLCEKERKAVGGSGFLEFASAGVVYLDETDLVYLEAMEEGCRLMLSDGRLLRIKDHFSDAQRRMYRRALLKVDHHYIINLDHLIALYGNHGVAECRLQLAGLSAVTLALGPVALSRLKKVVPEHYFITSHDVITVG